MSLDSLVVANVTELSAPRNLSLGSTDWGIGGNIAGEIYEFVFSWNKEEQCYSMRITSSGSFTMKRYLTDGWSIPITNFAPHSPAASDAVIGFYDNDTGLHASPRPSNMSSGKVSMIILRGLFV